MMIRKIEIRQNHINIDSAMAKAYDRATDGLDCNPYEVKLTLVSLNRVGYQENIHYLYIFSAKMDAEEDEENYDKSTQEYW